MGAIINPRLVRKVSGRKAREAKAAENRAAVAVPPGACKQSRNIRVHEEQHCAANRLEKPPVNNHIGNL